MVRLLIVGLLALAAGSADPIPATWIHITLNGRTVHNSHYLAASFLYQLQTLLGDANVMDGKVVRRQGPDLYIDLGQVPADKATILRQIAAREPPAADISLSEMGAYMDEHYYQLTRPYASLQALLKEHTYRDHPDNWLTVPIDSVTFRRRRVLRIHKDRIADALVSYFDHNDRVIYPLGTVIVAESFDKQGNFVEAEVLRKREDTFWNFSVYDSNGVLIPASFAFNEDGELAKDQPGFKASQNCAICHRLDRLDLSGDAEAPVLAPIRGFFHKLPAHVPQIHLGPEYYDHMAFTELTEANAKVKDGVFGVYGSLLLSELAGRKRLGTLTHDDQARYQRLRPYFPELLTPLERVDCVTNSIGMRLVRIPAPKSFFMSIYKQTNADFRRFHPDHHSAPYRDVALDGDSQPVVNVSFEDSQAFVAWLNQLPPERAAGRTYRLPTEEEWEFAAKGGDSRRFPWGDQWPPPEGSGNFADEVNGEHFHWEYLHGYHDPYLGTSPVGSFFPNPYFLYDMAGNAYEWTRDGVVRGSSWADELPKVLRCTFRIPMPPETKTPFHGFRAVADIPSLK